MLDLEQVSWAGAVAATDNGATPPTVGSAKRIIRVKKLHAQTPRDRGEHHIMAISEAVPGKTHDKSLSAHLQTVARLPDGCEADADKGSQGLAAQVSQVIGTDPETGVEPLMPRLVVKTPFKKPRGKALSGNTRIHPRK